MADNGAQLAVKQADHVPSVLIVLDGGQKVRVPVNADANRIESQIIAAKMRSLIDKQLDLYTADGVKLKPLVIKDLISSAAKVEEVARFAYAEGLTPDEGGESAKGSALVRAMAEGMTNAVMKSSSARMEKIAALGKPKNVTPVVDVE